MKKYDAVFFMVWIGLSLFFMGLSVTYGLGGFHAPGPGLMPFLTGALLLLISLYLLAGSFFKSRRRDDAATVMKEGQGQISYKKVILVLASMLAYALLLSRLGYILATFFVMASLFWTIGVKKLRTVFFAAFLTVLATYFLFAYLGVRFPPGILRFLG